MTIEGTNVNQPKLRMERVVSAMFDQNAYLVWLEGSEEAIIFDPGFEVEPIFQLVEKHGLKLVAICLTHGHADHIAGVGAVKKKFPDAPIVIGENEQKLLTDADLNLSRPMGFPIVAPPAELTLVDNQIYEVAGLRFRIREIPGHSPGSVVFITNGFSPEQVIAGDVIFSGSVGRTDFPGGSMRRLITGIHEKLLPLPPDTILHPGHGPSTNVGQEKLTNPYLDLKLVRQMPGLC